MKPVKGRNSMRLNCCLKFYLVVLVGLTLLFYKQNKNKTKLKTKKKIKNKKNNNNNKKKKKNNLVGELES